MIDTGVAFNFWAEVLNTTCHVINRCLIKSILNNTPYELMTKKKSKLSYFKPFVCTYFVLNNGKNDVGKFNPRSDKGVYVGYSSTIKAYIIYNKGTHYMDKSIHVVFDEVGVTSEGNLLNNANLEKLLNTPRKSNEGVNKSKE